MYKIKFSQPTSFFNPSVAMRQLPYPTTSAEEQNRPCRREVGTYQRYVRVVYARGDVRKDV